MADEQTPATPPATPAATPPKGDVTPDGGNKEFDAKTESERAFGKIKILETDYIKERKRHQEEMETLRKQKTPAATATKKETTPEGDPQNQQDPIKETVESLQAQITELSRQTQITNLQRDFEEQAQTAGMDPAFFSLAKKLMVVELEEKGVEHFSPAEYVREFLETYSGTKKKIATPPSTGKKSEIPQISREDYVKMTREEKKIELGRQMQSLQS